MIDTFSKIEIQLIRSSLATKTDEELADLLERPVEEITAAVNEITGGNADGRSERVQEVRELFKAQDREKTEAQANKERARLKREREAQERQSLKKEKEEKEQAKKNDVEFQMHQHQRQKTAWEARKTFKTRKIDWNVMKSVRVNKSTFIYVEKSISDEEAIKQYEFNQVHNGQQIKPGVKKQ